MKSETLQVSLAGNPIDDEWNGDPDPDCEDDPDHRQLKADLSGWDWAARVRKHDQTGLQEEDLPARGTERVANTTGEQVSWLGPPPSVRIDDEPKVGEWAGLCPAHTGISQREQRERIRWGCRLARLDGSAIMPLVLTAHQPCLMLFYTIALAELLTSARTRARTTTSPKAYIVQLASVICSMASPGERFDGERYCHRDPDRKDNTQCGHLRLDLEGIG